MAFKILAPSVSVFILTQLLCFGTVNGAHILYDDSAYASGYSTGNATDFLLSDYANETNVNGSVYSGDAWDSSNEVAGINNTDVDDTTIDTLDTDTSESPIFDINLPPPVFITVPFRNIRVPVYETNTPGYVVDPVESGVQYYYLPALLMDPAAVTVRLNPFTNSSEVVMPVFMWNSSYTQTIQDAVAKHMSQPLPVGSVQMLFFNTIMVRSSMPANTTDPISSDWISYGGQPGTVVIRFNCDNAAACSQIVKNIQQAPDYFVNNLTVWFYHANGDSVSNIYGTLNLVD